VGIFKPQIKLSYANFRLDGTKCIFPDICRLFCCRMVHKKWVMTERYRFRMKKLQIKNRFSNFLDALMRRNIIKMKLCVKLKKIMFFYFFWHIILKSIRLLVATRLSFKRRKNNFYIFLYILTIKKYYVQKKIPLFSRFGYFKHEQANMFTQKRLYI
jgi:hypothetical protein